MRTPFVAGNWKMNLTLAEARELVAALRQGLPSPLNVQVAVCPPFTLLFPMAKALDGLPILLGAQNLYPQQRGAFTGEISPAHLRDTACSIVILGHSERRHILHESGDFIGQKIVAATAAGLHVIYCLGETLAQRESGQTFTVIDDQLAHGLDPLHDADPAKLTIAYEPVWAIGTGRNASPEQAQQVHAHIRKRLAARYNAQFAAAIRIQYGGSVNAGNATSLLAQPDVDGALVGGASLKADEFLAIIRAAQAAPHKE